MFSVRDFEGSFYFNALAYSHSEAYEETERKIQVIQVHVVSLRVVF